MTEYNVGRKVRSVHAAVTGEVSGRGERVAVVFRHGGRGSLMSGMSTAPAAEALLAWARAVLERERSALAGLEQRLDHRFVAAVELCHKCSGHVVVSGVGKAGLVGRKISATLSSLGTPSHFLHPAEAFHGDLGAVRADDVALVLSFSGNTDEVVRLLPALRQRGVAQIAITGNAHSLLARQADVVLDIGRVEEAERFGLAPTTSTTLMLALGDALAVVLARLAGFQAEDFARNHPGGTLGRRLANVEHVMRPLDQCRCAPAEMTVREVMVHVSRPGRRTGAILITDTQGRLAGLFTDSDLARLLEQRQDSALDRPIREVMTLSPVTVPAGTRLGDAIGILAARRISELPVVDGNGYPLGLIDITDVLDLAVAGEEQESPNEPSSSEQITLPFDPLARRESA